MFLQATHFVIYASLSFLFMLVVTVVVKRPDTLKKSPAKPIEEESLKLLPGEFRLRMRKYVRGRSLPRQIRDSYQVQSTLRHEEAMRRIRTAS